MWTCNKCNTVHEDLYSSCPKCGASRSAGRFASAPPAKPAAYAAPPAEPRIMQRPAAQEPAPAAVPVPRPAPQATYIPNLDKVHAGGGMRFVGVVLAILLPVITGVIAYFKYDQLCPLLCGLFFEHPESEIPALLAGIYIVFALVAALLTALPGLWTLAIGKMLRRFARMEELL